MLLTRGQSLNNSSDIVPFIFEQFAKASLAFCKFVKPLNILLGTEPVRFVE